MKRDIPTKDLFEFLLSSVFGEVDQNSEQQSNFPRKVWRCWSCRYARLPATAYSAEQKGHTEEKHCDGQYTDGQNQFYSVQNSLQPNTHFTAFYIVV